MSYKEILAKVRESKDILSKKRAQYNIYKEKIDYLESLKLSFKFNDIIYENKNEKLAKDSFLIGNYSKAMESIEIAVSETESDFTESDKIQELISKLSASFESLDNESKAGFTDSLDKISGKLSKGRIKAARFDVDILSQSFDEHINIIETAENNLEDLEKLIDMSKDFILLDEFMDDSYQCRKFFESKEYLECNEKSNNLITTIKEALKEWQPELQIGLPSETTVSEWTKSSVKVSNIGKVNISSVVIEVKGIKAQDKINFGSISPGKSEELVNAFLVEGLGSIRISSKVSFTRAYDDLLFTDQVDDWIESKRTSSKSPLKSEIVETPIVDAVAQTEIATGNDNKHRDLIPEWKPPQTSEVETETVIELFNKRWESYASWPDNKKILDYLHNNHERLAVSSYFEIPTDPSVVIDEWALPDGIRGNVYLDSERTAHINRVLTSKTEQNFVIIGEPGVGKTTLLFEIFDSFMSKKPSAILTTSEISSVNVDYDIRLFYDDIPENPDLVESILKNESGGLVVTAREADWAKLPDDFQKKFKRLTVPLFSSTHIDNLCRRMLDFSNIRYDESAIDILKSYSQGSPIFIWLLIREMRFSGSYFLTKGYVEDNSRKGMENYVSLILQKLLKKGSDYKVGGMHSLACMIFLSDYMKDRKCHELLYRSFADEIEHDFADKFGDQQSPITFNQTIVYLSGEGSLIRFPHDTWADVLQGVGRMNPLRADIQSIKIRFAEETFEDYKMLAVKDSWGRIKSRYNRNKIREKDSFLSFSDILTNNFTISELEKVEVDVDMIREVASINADLPIAARIISRIESASSKQVTNIIKIQDSIINRSTLNFEGEENIEDSIINRNKGI